MAKNKDNNEAEKSLIDLLNSRYQIAKSFTKDFHSEVKRNIDDFEAVTPNTSSSAKKTGVYNRHVSASRYDITIPYIFATHESMVSSFFENMPDLVITGRTAKTDKEQVIKAVYEYFKDKADLDEFLSISAWWFFLTGFVKGDVEFKTKIKEYVPQLDSQGNPMMGEPNEEGEIEPIEIPVYEYNDPFATVENPLKVSFSPESEFTISGEKVPYYIKERLIDVDEIKETYEKEVEPDETLEVDDVDKKDSGDLKRAKVLYYYGTLPSSVEPALKKYNIDWEFGLDYRIYHTKNVILHIEQKSKPCKFARFYSNMNKFFGFGIGKTLRPFQEDMSIRRGQQIAYADRFAFPWLMLPNGVKVDQKNLMDYMKRNPLSYSTDGKDPAYLVPPQMPSIIAEADNASRNDAQFVSGTLDLSKGAQQTNTVKTATGQQLFAQSQDKRLNKARKSIAKYYREIVISMFKEARDNWNEPKVISYPDEDGNMIDMEVSSETLQDIDFDTEIDFNLDSVSVNQDIVSQRWLSMLETSLTVPNADVDKVYKKTLSESFKIPNPESYVKEPVDPNMPPVDTTVPPETPIDNPETTPEPQSLGSQLAPNSPYVGA